MPPPSRPGADAGRGRAPPGRRPSRRRAGGRPARSEGSSSSTIASKTYPASMRPYTVRDAAQLGAVRSWRSAAPRRGGIPASPRWASSTRLVPSMCAPNASLPSAIRTPAARAMRTRSRLSCSMLRNTEPIASGMSPASAWATASRYTAWVGTSQVPCSAISRARSSSRNTPCSIERTPARTQRLDRRRRLRVGHHEAPAPGRPPRRRPRSPRRCTRRGRRSGPRRAARCRRTA